MKHRNDVRSEIFTVIKIEFVVFWVVMSCSVVRFWGTCCLHLQRWTCLFTSIATELCNIWQALLKCYQSWSPNIQWNCSYVYITSQEAYHEDLKILGTSGGHDQ